MTVSADCVTTMADAKVTRLPPVRFEKPTLLVSPISTLMRLGWMPSSSAAMLAVEARRAADVGMAGHHHDVAVLGDVDLGAQFAAGIEPVAGRDAAALVGPSGDL